MAPDARRPLSTFAAGARVVSGWAFVLGPRKTGGLMIGSEEAGQPGTRLFVQAFGARDVILGAGALAASAKGKSARRWLFANAAADVADAVLGAPLFRRRPACRRVPSSACRLRRRSSTSWWRWVESD